MKLFMACILITFSLSGCASFYTCKEGKLVQQYMFSSFHFKTGLTCTSESNEPKENK